MKILIKYHLYYIQENLSLGSGEENVNKVKCNNADSMTKFVEFSHVMEWNWRVLLKKIVFHGRCDY